ncbi:MAG TPA: hypothetical protein VER26_12955, partial [Xanthobacteraceae bacterium]|nr:hypothetical protein [Xanthobacteraceae bacterium]
RRGEISPYSRLESGSEGIANVVVDCQQLLTSEGHRSDANHRDKRGDQRSRRILRGPMLI